MMKQTLEVLVFRVNGEVVDYEGINDHYTAVQVALQKSYDLDAEALDYLRTNDYIREDNNNFYFYENEAKDMELEEGNLRIKIEKVELKF